MAAVETNTTDGGVRWLRLNRPEKLNAIDDEARESLHIAVQEASREAEVRCLVLTGNGRAFCSGGDVSKMEGRGPAVTTTRMFRGAPLLYDLINCEKPTVAALNGLATGAGASMAIACDFVYAASSAWLSFIFVERGLVPDFSSTYFLPRIVGLSRAKELMLTGRRVSATEAQTLGLVTEVLDDEYFETLVQERAERVAAGNIETMALIRRGVNHSFESDFRAVLEREALAQGIASSTEEHERAVAAFTKRTKDRG